jgi:excisionase family DNA binding protein
VDREIAPKYFVEDVEQSAILSLAEVAELLHCSKAHVCNAIRGRVKGVTPLPAISMGRRKLVRRESLKAWLAENNRAPSSAMMERSHRNGAVDA